MTGSSRADGTPSAPLLLWGWGGHGRVVHEIAHAAGRIVIGVVDADPGKLDGSFAVEWLESEFLEAWEEHGVAMLEGAELVLAFGEVDLRMTRIEAFEDVLARALVHPSALVSPSARLGRGVTVHQRAVINTAAQVGVGSIINTGAIVEHDCVLGPGVHLAPGSVLTGGVRAEAGAWIGAGATVVGGCRIGPRSTIGAGAVVLKDVDARAKVAGVPARRIG